MQALILDLRWNPGGLLEQAVDVCEKFLPRGHLVVTTEGRNRQQTAVRKARGRGDELNRHAHGGAGQPRQRQRLGNRRRLPAGLPSAAIILGEQTFGKGSVQSILPLCRRLGACA